MRQVTTTEANEIMEKGEQNIYIKDKMGKKIKLYIKSDIMMMDTVGIKMYVDDDCTKATNTLIIIGTCKNAHDNKVLYNLELYGQTTEYQNCTNFNNIVVVASHDEIEDMCFDAYITYFGSHADNNTLIKKHIYELN